MNANSPALKNWPQKNPKPKNQISFAMVKMPEYNFTLRNPYIMLVMCMYIYANFTFLLLPIDLIWVLKVHPLKC